MFTEDISVNLLDILLFSRGKMNYYTRERSFFALSYRINSGCRYTYKGKKLSAKAGDVTIVPSGLSYEWDNDGSDAIVFHFDLFGFVSKDIEIFTPEDTQKYKKFFTDALEIWGKKEPGYKYRATAVFYEILAQLQADGAYANEIKDRRIADAVDFMKRNFSNSELSVAELAQNACMCDTLFRRKFREYCGVSPKKYLEGLRMEYAVHLLKTGYFSHEQVAEKCGYLNVKYFRTAFKKFIGKSISEYLRI